jgi:hypothetical protein
MKLLGIGSDAKTVKGEKKGYLTAITYLAPSDASGVTNTCPSASKGCRKACLFTSGRGRMSNVMEARINKTKFFVDDQVTFMLQLKREIIAFIKKASKLNLIPCVRLNGTSDIAWEDIELDGKNIMEHFSGLQFYDYTKRLTRMVVWLAGGMPRNYHLTFSRSENTSDAVVRDILKEGGNVAVVYADKLPDSDFGFVEVVNGDESDLRFRDRQSVIVGLTYKRTTVAKDDAIESGFVLHGNALERAQARLNKMKGEDAMVIA